MFRIHLFGEFSIQDKQGNPLKLTIRKAQLLLAYLLLNPGQLKPRERLVDLFWPDSDEAKAERSLNQTLYVIRNLLEPKGTPKGTYIITKQRAVQFNLDSDFWVDIHEFETLIKAGDYQSGDEKVNVLEQALTLYSGDLIEGSYDDWCLEARESFRTLYLNALKGLVEQHIADNNFSAALNHATQSLAKDPYQEETYRQLMFLHNANGDRAAALNQYQELEKMLTEELDIEPLPETTALYEEIKGRSDSSQINQIVKQTQSLQTHELGSPFVDRTEPLQQFAQAWNTITDGQGQAIWISGEAGVGKSRFVNECLLYASEKEAFTLTGRCYEMEGALPYQPLIESIRNALSKLPENVIEGISERALMELVKIVPEFQNLFPELEPSSLLESPDQERSRLFQALHQFFQKISEYKPIIFYFDDLQWVDDSTLQFVHYLVRHLSEMKVLLLAVYRDAEVDEDHHLFATLQHLTRDHLIQNLKLAPLNAEDTESLVQGLLNNTALETFSQSIYEESKGLPFFTEELVKSLIEAGILVYDDQGQWHTELDQIPQSAVTTGIRALVSTRLRRLNRNTRQVLELAAVIGKSFTFDLLLKVMGPWQVELLKPIEDLLWSRFLHEDDGNYQFHHDLVRQIIYEDIAPERCRQYHLRLAESLEEILTEEPYLKDYLGDIAHHFHRAKKLKKALDYSMKAGLFIWQSTYAKEESLHFLNRALELSDMMEDEQSQMRTQKILGEIYSTTDEHEKGMELSLQALAICGDIHERTDIYCTIARVHHYQQNINEALSYCQKALDELGDQATSPQAAKAYAYAGGFLNWLSRFEESINYCEKASEILKSHPNKNLHTLILSQLGHAHSGLGNNEEALNFLSEAASLAEKAGDREAMSQAFFRLAIANFNHGNLDESIHAWAKTLKTLQAIGNRIGDEAIMFNWLTFANMRQGDLEQALIYAQQQLEKNQLVERTESVASSYGMLGSLLDATGDESAAQAAFSQSLELAPDNGKVYQGIIMSYLYMDMADQALNWLEKGQEFLEARQIQHLNTCPIFTPAFATLRQAGGFQSLVKEN